MKWALCNCGKWGWVPTSFDERKHFMRCDCGKTMFLHHSGDSTEIFPPEDKIIPGTFPHKEKP